MVNSRAPQCHPIVDSRLEEELVVPTLSGRQPTVHRHYLSQPRALPSPRPRAPSPRAYTIPTDPGDRQTSPFAAPCRTTTARRRRRRLCRAEHRSFQTKPHRPMPRDHVVEHRQETPHRPLPLPMPLAAYNLAPNKITVRPTIPSLNYK